MTALFGTKYFGFIASAFGISALVILLLIVWVIVTHRQRIRELSRLEDAGYRRSSDD